MAAKELLQKTILLVKGIQGNEHGTDELRLLATTMGHVHNQTPVMRDVLTDRFATAAITALLSNSTQPRDPRLQARVLALLQLQGKTAAAQEWAKTMPAVELEPMPPQTPVSTT